MFKNFISRNKARRIIIKEARETLEYWLAKIRKKDHVSDDTFKAQLEKFVLEKLEIAHAKGEEYLDIYQNI